MQNNQVFEFSGSAQIIFRAIDDYEINGRPYKKDDVALYIPSAECTISYYKKNSIMANGKDILMSYSENSPTSISLRNLPLTAKDLNFFNSTTKNVFNMSFSEKATAIENAIVPTKKVIGNKIFIVELNKNLYSDNGIFIDSELVNYVYTIIYTIEANGYEYSIDNDEDYIPYLSIEIIGIGNQDKVTVFPRFYAPVISIIDTPSFDFIKGGMSFYDLGIRIIENGSGNKVKFSVRDEI